MKARIDFYCKPSTETADYECEEIYMEIDLPFVPPVGTMLKLTPEGDYIKVSDIHLDINPGGYGLNIGLKEPDEGWELRPWLEMKAQGWKLA